MLRSAHADICMLHLFQLLEVDHCCYLVVMLCILSFHRYTLGVSLHIFAVLFSSEGVSILLMAQNMSGADSHQKRSGLLKDQVRLVKRKDSNHYEIAPIQIPLSFEKGFFIVIRACQLLAQKNDGIILVGVAGPSGAGKSVFTEKILNFMPSVAVISMDNYNDSSRIVDGNFDGKSSTQLILSFFFF